MALELLRIDPWDGDSTSGTTYYGYAAAGTQNTESKWSIKRKRVVDGVLVYEYPYISGDILPETSPAIFHDNTTYMKTSGLIWDQRTGYTYK